MIQKTMATVVSVKRLNPSVWQYILQPDQWVAYHAGQYLQIHGAEGDNFFSIANAPLGAQTYALHIRPPRDPHKQAVLQTQLALHQRVSVSLPFGHCDITHLQPQKPILFIAAGTGFAPIQAMIQYNLAEITPRKFELYWSVHTAEDFYLSETLQDWRQQISDFYYCAHVTQKARSSLISQVLSRHPNDIQDWQIVMAGPFDLMILIRDALVLAGVTPDAIFSDAFEF